MKIRRSRKRFTEHEVIAFLSEFKFVILLSQLCFWYFVSYGKFSFYRTEEDGRAFYYGALARNILKGKLDVDPTYLAGFAGECLIRDGKCYSYYGITPTLLRLPLEILGVNTSRISSFPFMNLGYFLFSVLGFFLLSEIFKFIKSDVKYRFKILLMLNIVSSPILFLSIRGWIYEEAILWGVVFFTATLVFSVMTVTRANLKYFWYAFITALLTLHSRPTLGIGSLALFCTLGVALRFDKRRIDQFLINYLPKKAVYKGNFHFEKRHLFLTLSLFGAGIISYITLNILKFGTALPHFANIHGGTKDNPARKFFYEKWGEFNFHRIWHEIILWTFPNTKGWPNDMTYYPGSYKFSLLNLQIGHVSIESTEFFAPISIVYPSLVLLSLVGALYFVRCNFPSSLKIAFIIGTVLPIFILCSYIAMTQRYAADFLAFLLPFSVLALSYISRIKKQFLALIIPVFALLLQIYGSQHVIKLFWGIWSDRSGSFNSLILF